MPSSESAVNAKNSFVVIPLYPKSILINTGAVNSREEMVLNKTRKNSIPFTPTAPRRRHRDATIPPLRLDGVSRESPLEDLETMNHESALVRYIPRPIVLRLISRLPGVDDRVTSYNTQFLKALFIASPNLAFRWNLIFTLRLTTKSRALRAR